MENLLTPEEISQRYGVSIWTVYQWTSKNLIPHLKIRGMVRFREEEIGKWENQGAIKVSM